MEVQHKGQRRNYLINRVADMHEENMKKILINVTERKEV